MKTEQIAIIAAGVVVVAAVASGLDGIVIATFFGFLAGLGLGRKQQGEVMVSESNLAEAVRKIVNERPQ